MTAPGEQNLSTLIAGMQPKLDPETYVFVTCAAMPEGLAPMMTFQESEGLTLIIERGAATAAGLDFTFPCKRITLEIHSALDAVGFIAAIAAHLAQAGMGVNPVSAYFHDHLFVPEARAAEAMALLKDLSLRN